VNEPVYIIDGARTPFLKARNRPGRFARPISRPTPAARCCCASLRTAELDEVILGCAAPSADEVNIGRVVALRMGCGTRCPAGP
jgi:acetyl-CoA C-acetyltransferase